MRCCVTCRGHRSRRWHRSSFQPTAQPLVVGGVCRSWDWPGGWTAQGTLQVRPCKLGRRIHAAHVPAQPTRPATDSFRVRPPRKRKRRSKAEADRFALHPRMAWIYRVDQGRHPPAVAVDPPSPGNCRGWGGVGPQDRWRHGWRHRAPRGEGALLAKHCFASARTHSRQRLGRFGGLRRVLQPHTAPPNRQQPRAALALALASAGAGLQALHNNYVTQPAITSNARIASHSSSIRHTRLIASRRSGSRCHTGNSPASV